MSRVDEIYLYLCLGYIYLLLIFVFKLVDLKEVMGQSVVLMHVLSTSN